MSQISFSDAEYAGRIGGLVQTFPRWAVLILVADGHEHAHRAPLDCPRGRY